MTGAVEIAGRVNAGTVAAREVTEAALRRVERHAGLNAFQQVWPERARRAADAVDRAVARGERPPLAGVPIGVKAWEGLESAQVRRLLAAGCVPIGVTSVPAPGTAWRTGGRTDRGPTANPWRTDRTPGGSSAGSAAAVAAGLVPLATGTDGAGSIRIPAAWCGIVGLKLTNGRLPTRDPAGLAAPGPLTRTVADAAAYLEVIAGSTGSADPGTVPVRAAWTPDLGYADSDPATAGIAYAAARRLADADAIALTGTPVRLEDPAPAWRARRSGGTATVRDANDRVLADVFEEVDLILTPTAPGGPHGHDGPGPVMNVALTWAFNLTGHPAASVPAGFDGDGLPVGLQLVARHGEERLLLRVAAALERLAPWPAPRVTVGLDH